MTGTTADRRLVYAAAGAIALLVLGSVLAIYRPWAPADRFAACRSTAVAGGAADIGGPFSLIDQTGARVTDAEVIDRPSLVYFGYSFCPDVCPTDLSRNAQAVDALAEHGLDVKPVFITVDPDRDTPEAMADFVGYMHEKMVGLTGSADEIKAAADAYRVYYARRGSGDDYLMDHTSYTYLMAPGQGMLELFRSDMPAEEMADRVGCFVDRL